MVQAAHYKAVGEKLNDVIARCPLVQTASTKEEVNNHLSEIGKDSRHWRQRGLQLLKPKRLTDAIEDASLFSLRKR